MAEPAKVLLSRIKLFNLCWLQKLQYPEDKHAYSTLEDELSVVCLCGCVQESQSEVGRLQKQKDELCAQIRDLSLPLDLASESLPDLKKQLRLLESQASERAQEITTLTAKIQQQQQVLTRIADTLRHVHLLLSVSPHLSSLS